MSTAEHLRVSDAVRRVSKRALGLLLALLVLGGIVAPAANAAPVASIISDAPISGSCGSIGGSAVGSASTSSLLLPVNRWIEATDQFHSRDSGFLSGLGGIQRDLTGGPLMSGGNALWGWTTTLTTNASQACPIEAVGARLDGWFASFGNGLLHGESAGLLGGLIVITIGLGIWRTARRQGGFPVKEILGKVAVVALMAVMVNGAGNTTETSFGSLSPGWMLSQTNKVVTSIASTPATLVSSINDGVGVDLPTDGASAGPMSCYAYRTQLIDDYKASYSTNGVLRSSASLPLVLNNIWQSTGLQAWKNAQFGAQNSYGDLVYCRLLEMQTGTPVVSTAEKPAWMSQATWDASTRHSLTQVGALTRVMNEPQAATINASLPNAAAWAPNTPFKKDVSLIAWAACDLDDQGLWTIRTAGSAGMPLVRGGEDARQKVVDLCSDWMGKPVGDFNPTDQSRLNWGDDADEIATDSTSPEVTDFLLTMHGNKGGTAGPIGITYVFASLSMLLTFGGLSIIVIVAKAMLVVTILLMMVVLIGSLLPNVSAGDQLARLGRRTLGLIALSASAVLLFAVFAAVTSAIIMLGSAFSEPGTVGSMVWTGIAPLATFVALGVGFKKVGIPNPMTVKGAMAWGGSAGMVGGAAASAIGQRTSQAGHAAKRLASREGSKMLGGALHKATGGSLGTEYGSGGRRNVQGAQGEGDFGKADKTDKRSKRGVKGEGAPIDVSDFSKTALSDDEVVLAGSAGTVDPALMTPEEKAAAVAKNRRDAAEFARHQWYEKHGDSFRSALHRRRTQGQSAFDDAGNFTGVERKKVTKRDIGAAAWDSTVARWKNRNATLRTAASLAGRGTVMAGKTGLKAAAGVAAFGMTGGWATPILAAAAFKGGVRTARSAARGTRALGANLGVPADQDRAMNMLIDNRARARARERAEENAKRQGESDQTKDESSTPSDTPTPTAGTSKPGAPTAMPLDAPRAAPPRAQAAPGPAPQRRPRQRAEVAAPPASRVTPEQPRRPEPVAERPAPRLEIGGKRVSAFATPEERERLLAQEREATRRSEAEARSRKRPTQDAPDSATHGGA